MIPFCVFICSHNHVRRDGLHKRLTQEFHGVTEKACILFLAGCEECHLRKAKKSVKSIVVKPISSTQFLSRCQVDLIDFRDMSRASQYGRFRRSI